MVPSSWQRGGPITLASDITDPAGDVLSGQNAIERLAQKRECPRNGVSGVHLQSVSAAGMRSAKVTANAFSAGFYLVTQRA